MFVVERDGFLHPVNMRVVLHQPGHSQNYLGPSEADNHERQVIVEGSGLAANLGGGGNSSLLVWSAINI